MKGNSKELYNASLKIIPGAVHSPVRSFSGVHETPIFFDSANGAKMTSEEGRDYIDFCMSFGPLILGHRDPIVEESLKMALSKGWSFGTCERYSYELSDYLVSRIDHIDKIRFVNSGTEAVMTALRLARGFTRRNKIIKFNGCYHGHTDSMLIKAGSGVATMTESSSKGVPPGISNDTIVCELGDYETVEGIFETHGNDIAAIIIEPLPANNGLLVQEKSFIVKLDKLAKKYKSLMIFDEVISGFRVAFGGMAEILGIKPDICTYGKIIGGGLPVGAVCGRGDIMDYLAPVGGVYQAGTLSANPLAMVGGLATLKQLDANSYIELEEVTNNIVRIIGKWANKYVPTNVVHKSSLFWLSPGEEVISKASNIPANIGESFQVLFTKALEKGIYFAPSAYEVGFVSLAHKAIIHELEVKLND
ncbi:glutamate-1-semialdehyde 2,1-aminomutase [Bacteriovoracaceae bacterium]|nr:glutamate-1-semialdehyde 2,1-aminomutase [Bacteriovoracaceae bacterium]